MTTSRSQKAIQQADETADYLQSLGDRVRAARARHGMTRKILATQSGVSERYLAQLETGRGNVSILVLRQIAAAMDLDILDLLSDTVITNLEARLLHQEFDRLSPEQQKEARYLLQQNFPSLNFAKRGTRISLVGLRGAGKSTLGPMLAEKLDFQFVELNKLVEKEFGADLGEIFSLAGQPSFRRIERRCLSRLIEDGQDYVIATGGSIVADEETYAMLLKGTHAIWVQTSPAEHMSRVVSQGDMRPMSGNNEAMVDLEQILIARSSLYEKAEGKLNTSKQSVDESLQVMVELVSKIIPEN
jgi:XRE family transcriptional regulator, aerobic/anaerobic benzoate catabolism transcriptional regulator